MNDSQKLITTFFVSFAGNGSNSPAQNSTRSISPNTANNNNIISSNGHIIQPVSPQTPLQLQTSSSSSPQQSHHLLNNSVNLGNITPTFSTPQQVKDTSICVKWFSNFHFSDVAVELQVISVERQRTTHQRRRNADARRCRCCHAWNAKSHHNQGKFTCS